MGIQFIQTKCDKGVPSEKILRRVFCNPLDVELCPITHLGIHVIVNWGNIVNGAGETLLEKALFPGRSPDSTYEGIFNRALDSPGETLLAAMVATSTSALTISVSLHRITG